MEHARISRLAYKSRWCAFLHEKSVIPLWMGPPTARQASETAGGYLRIAYTQDLSTLQAPHGSGPGLCQVHIDRSSEKSGWKRSPCDMKMPVLKQ